MPALEKPSEKFKDSFLEAVGEFAGCIKDPVTSVCYLNSDYDSIKKDMKSFVEGLNSIAGQYHFWIIDDEGKYAGRVVLRDTEAKNVCRLSYEVLPKMRGKGIASAAMALAKAEAKKLGFDEIIILCTLGNEPSYRVIEKNGGQNKGEVTDESGNPKMKYIIGL